MLIGVDVGQEKQHDLLRCVAIYYDRRLQIDCGYSLDLPHCMVLTSTKKLIFFENGFSETNVCKYLNVSHMFFVLFLKAFSFGYCRGTSSRSALKVKA